MGWEGSGCLLLRPPYLFSRAANPMGFCGGVMNTVNFSVEKNNTTDCRRKTRGCPGPEPTQDRPDSESWHSARSQRPHLIGSWLARQIPKPTIRLQIPLHAGTFTDLPHPLPFVGDPHLPFFDLKRRIGSRISAQLVKTSQRGRSMPRSKRPAKSTDSPFLYFAHTIAR